MEPFTKRNNHNMKALQSSRTGATNKTGSLRTQFPGSNLKNLKPRLGNRDPIQILKPNPEKISGKLGELRNKRRSGGKRKSRRKSRRQRKTRKH